jgi:hypothetical protein
MKTRLQVPELYGYEIMTNASYRGGNATIRVDCSTGAITAAADAAR